MATPKDEQIFVQHGETVIELTGDDKEAFIADRKATLEAQNLIQAERNAKAAARISALAKLAELGLTEEEVAAL
jgi:hypothetical protein